MILLWKQRLYAFLLRRVLGPFLTSASNQKLHQCIDDVSLQEGKYCLSNIELNAEQISSLYTSQLGLQITSIRINKLEISLSLQEEGADEQVDEREDDEDGGPSKNKSSSGGGGGGSSSLAWRAMQLGKQRQRTKTETKEDNENDGTDEPSPGQRPSAASVSLVARVHLDGVSVELQACPKQKKKPTTTVEPPPSTADDPTTSISTAKSMIASYIEAALSSLRLSVQMNQLRVRVNSACTTTSTTDENNDTCTSSAWLEVCAQSIGYQDIVTTTSNNNNDAMMMPAASQKFHKAVEFTRVTVLTGATSSSSITDQSTTSGPAAAASNVVALVEGTNQLNLRVYHHNKSESNNITFEKQDSDDVSDNNNNLRVQQDIEILLNQKLNISVDATSLVHVRQVVQSFHEQHGAAATLDGNNYGSATNTTTVAETPSSSEAVVSPPWMTTNNNTDPAMDEADCQALNGIMKQYQEARLLAERKEVRGGVLVASLEENGEMTYDAFFDANEQSFSKYSSVLKESIFGGNATSNHHVPVDWVHTKLRFRLQEGGVKLSFKQPNDPESSGYHRHEEYMLLTFNEVSLSASVSGRSSQIVVSMNYMELEDSLLVENPDGVGRSSEITSLMRFSAERTHGRDDDDSDLLVQAPCLSLQINSDRNDDATKMDLELTLEPIEFVYRPVTVSKLTDMLKSIAQEKDDKNITSEAEPVTSDLSSTLTVYAACPSITCSLPLRAEVECSSLYERCGYVSESSLSAKSCFGLVFEQLSLDFDARQPQGGIEASVSAHSMIAYASSPLTRNSFDQRIRRFDILAVCGRTEVNPCIPITLKLSRLHAGEDGSKSEEMFPKVPAMSTFKARQEDDDDDDRIDRVLTSKLNDLTVNSRKDLRATGDPQSLMLPEVSKSTMLLSLYTPEIIGDVSSTEMLLLKKMAGHLLPDTSGEAKSDEVEPKGTTIEPVKRIAVLVSCDFMSLAVHGPSFDVENCYSYMLKTDRFKAHALLDGLSLKHTRVLCHEVDLFEISELVQRMSFHDAGQIDQRLEFLRERGNCHESSSAVPLVHRSHLFEPISRESPAILLDLLNIDNEEQGMAQQKIYFSVYDTTYRHPYDSQWLKRLRSLFSDDRRKKQASEGGTCSEITETGQSLTRVFFTLADCNFDYSSCPRFKTASRVIARIGDFRISSNIVAPAATVQAFSVSLADVSLQLCDSRFPYIYENSRLLHTDAVFHSSEYSFAALGLPSDVEGDIVHKAMNYRTVLTLDSLDSVVALSTRKMRALTDPSISASFTVGQISVFACKDSFARFVATIAEATTEVTALNDEALEDLKKKSVSDCESLRNESTESDSFAESGKNNNRSLESHHTRFEHLKQQSVLRPAPGTGAKPVNFLLDGYDWTTIDSDECGKPGIPPGEEQLAKWYGAPADIAAMVGGLGSTDGDTGGANEVKSGPPKIISHHFPLLPMSDPISDGDMGVAKYVEPGTKTQVGARVLVHDLSLSLRLFDGYDWPELLDENERARSPRGNAFIIPEVRKKQDSDDGAVGSESNDIYAAEQGAQKSDRMSKLMGDLLSGAPEQGGTFRSLPLPEERGRTLKEQAELRRLARRTGRYLQIAAAGVSVRMDTMEESRDHLLASCLNLKVQDFFLAESISSDRPVKMIGEWFNEDEHPRDSKDGLIMMKIVTWHPARRLTLNQDVANDESKVGITILPLRCIIDQRAVGFARAFFNNGNGGDTNSQEEKEDTMPPGLHPVPPPLFTMFRVRAFKVKVDYRPRKLDSRALRDGAVVELVNLSPLDAMVLTLRPVEIENEIGFGAAASVLVGRWVQDICKTQLIKFLTNTRPLEPITEVSGAATDMVVLPWEAFRNGESIQKALRSGAKSFSKTLVYEFCSITSKAAEFFAGNVSRAGAAAGPGPDNVLPARPFRVTRNVMDATPHAVESLSRGFQAANYKIVIVPYREYQRRGTTGAARSVLKGIPVAIAAPASGAAEALSYALVGARNQIRPDIRKEEEACIRGLRKDG